MHLNGFTLVEILVVLILTSLITGILFQAMERMYRLQDRFGIELAYAQQDVMIKDWFRQTIEGLLPDYADGQNKFRGTARQLSGLTINPLNIHQYGAPSEFEWKLVFDPNEGSMHLVYTENGQAASMLSWAGNIGRFIYLDSKGEAHETWPPPLGIWPQLPKQVQVQAIKNSGSIVVLATPMGPASPLPRIQDLFGNIR